MQQNRDPRTERGTGSITSRRGFVAALSLSAVSLYGIWAGYGAAPLDLAGGGHGDKPEAAPPAGDHGGHGGGGRGPTAEEFRRQAEEFIARHRQADGSVLVDAVATPAAAMGAADAHRGHGSDHKATAAQPMVSPSQATDVYLLAQQWLFEPDVLRLRADAAYRFRMMSVDAGHGAALQLGKGSRIIRLRPGALVEHELSFARPGEYLVYCTLYCGIGHDRMHGRIIVT